MHPCPNCGKTTERKFCKASCGSAFRARLKRQESAVPLPQKPCRRCGESFTPVRSTQEYCRSECRKPIKADADQGLPPGELDQTVYRMITKGFLPSPTCTSPNGAAVWSVHGLAALFDLDPLPFLALMARRPPAYLPEPGIPSSWSALLERGS